MTSPRVLFVSKPIAPPWNDGSKNLVRDVAANLTRARATVLTTPDAPALDGVHMEPLYAGSGGFAPGLLANARVLRRLLRGDPHDLWHFAFAPNAASSSAARVAMTARRATGWRGKVVQTVASAPRSFHPALFFGDRVVALSEWTRGQLLGAGLPSTRLQVIPPCARPPREVAPEETARVRAELGVSGKLVLYPGDYEVSTGAETVVRAAPDILRQTPDVTIVLACRAKTSGAAAARASSEALARSLGVADRVRHAGELPDLAALLAATDLVLFPVDDLYGKVDLPLVLLEALAVGIPMVLARGGPLEAIDTARFVEPEDVAGLAAAARLLLATGGHEQREAGRALYARCYAPAVVARAYDDLYATLC